jgi:hypothetical protein
MNLVDRGLYPFLALLMAAIAFVGFAPGYLPELGEGSPGPDPVLHVHVLVYVGWLLLFAVQSSLPALGKTRVHRQLGSMAIVYGILIVLTGLAVTFNRLADWAADGLLAEKAPFFLLPLTDLLYFIGFFGLALHWRRKPELHKRMMVLTGTLLIFPGAVRIEALTSPMVLPLFYLAWLSPVLLAVVHDAVFRRRFFMIYGIGALLLMTMPLRMVLFQGEGALAVVEAFAGLLG